METNNEIRISPKITIVKCDKCGDDFDERHDAGLQINSASLLNITGKTELNICMSCFVKVLINS